MCFSSVLKTFTIVKNSRMEVVIIFCLAYLPSPMKTNQNLGGASIDIDKNSFEEQLEGTEFGSIDSNENFNRDRLYMDAEKEDLTDK